MQNIVVGAGFSGAAIAYLLAEELNQKVIIIDKKDTLLEIAMIIVMKTVL